MSDIPPEDRSPSTQPTGPTEHTDTVPPTAAPPPDQNHPARSAPVPPPPGPVFVPAGLGLPVGYYTPAPAAGTRPRSVPFARRKFSALVVGGGVILGLLTGGVVGAGAMSLAASDHHDQGQVDTGHDSGDGIGNRRGPDENGR